MTTEYIPEAEETPSIGQDAVTHALSKMPPLPHWPDRSVPFDWGNSSVISHILSLLPDIHPEAAVLDSEKQLDEAIRIYVKAKRHGKIFYDTSTNLWFGVPAPTCKRIRDVMPEVDYAGKHLPAYTKDDIIQELHLLDGVRPGVLQKQLREMRGMSKSTFYRLAAELREAGVLIEKVSDDDKLWFKSLKGGKS